MLLSSDLQPGDHVYLKDYGKTDVAFRRQLLILGMVPGAKVRIVAKAPLGTPLQIAVGDTLLAVRQEEIAQIQWERL